MSKERIAELEAEIAALKQKVADNEMFYGNKYPDIVIEELREAGSDGGGFMGYYCRGHVDPAAFAWAANYHGDHQSGGGYDPRYVETKDVHHVWWRTVPIAGDDGNMQYIPASGPGKGAWSATVWDAYITRTWRDHRCRMKDHDQGRLRGIEEALSWVVNLFRWGSGTKEDMDRDREISERILTAWRAHGDETLRRERERENA